MHQLLLVGAGASNLLLIRALAKRTELQIRCICQEDQIINPASLPERISGHLTTGSHDLYLSYFLSAHGVEWIAAKVRAIHPNQQTVQLQDNQTLGYDWLGLNSTPQPYRSEIEARIPGAREYGFFVYPIERFTQQWEQVCQQTASCNLRIGILGDTLRSMELALAIRQRYSSAAVTWIIAPNSPCMHLPGYPVLLAALKKQRIHVLVDQVLAIQHDALQLQCGAQLANDIPIIALQPTAPSWVADHTNTVWFEPPDSTDYAAAINTIMCQLPRKMQFFAGVRTYYAGNTHSVAQWKQHLLEGRLAGWVRKQQNRLGGLYTH